MFLAMQVFP